MKYKISINNIIYDVEIDDINTRPVIAFVDGERIEVMPEKAEQAGAKKETGETENKAEKKCQFQKTT